MEFATFKRETVSARRPKCVLLHSLPDKDQLYEGCPRISGEKEKLSNRIKGRPLHHLVRP